MQRSDLCAFAFSHVTDHDVSSNAGVRNSNIGFSCFLPPVRPLSPLFSLIPETMKKLQGIIPPLVTPLIQVGFGDNASLEIDRPGTEKVIDHAIRGGVSGIFILGSTGEFASLSLERRKQLIEVTCQVTNDRVPVLVGVSDTCVETTLELARYSKSCGAAAIVMTAPYYFRMSQDDMLQYVDDIITHPSTRTNNAGLLPILLYNMPELTKFEFDIDTVRELMTKYSPHKIVGIKDSSGNLEYLKRLCQLRDEVRPNGDWSVFVGPDGLTARALELGADGAVPSGANFEPQLFTDLYDACRTVYCERKDGGGADNNNASGAVDDDAIAKKKETIETLSAKVEALTGLYALDQWFVVAKNVCYCRGLIRSDVLAPPFRALSSEKGEDVQQILDRVAKM